MFQSNNNAFIEYVIFDKIKIIAKNYGINWSQNGNDKFWKYQSFKNTWNNSTFKYIYTSVWRKPFGGGPFRS